MIGYIFWTLMAVWAVTGLMIRQPVSRNKTARPKTGPAWEQDVPFDEIWEEDL